VDGNMREERKHGVWKYYPKSLHNYGYCKEITKFSEFKNLHFVYKLTWVGKTELNGHENEIGEVKRLMTQVKVI